MNLDSAIGTIFLTDHYRYVRLYYATRFLVIAAAITMFSGMANVWLSPNDPAYRYIMTTPTGRIMNMIPLEEPNMSDEAVVQWAIDATTRVYTFDFLNYRGQFQDSQQLMTVSGWDGFMASMDRSGNMSAILVNKFTTTAVPTGPGVVVSRQLLQAGSAQRYGWTVEFPMLVTYRSSKQDTSQDLKMRVQVVRMPEYVNQSGVALRSILAK